MRPLAGLLLALLLLSAPAPHASAAIDGSHGLGWLEPGESAAFEVRIQNGGADAIGGSLLLEPSLVQGHGAEDLEGFPSWFDLGDGQWTVEAGKSASFDFTLQVPEDAHAGRYRALVVFQEESGREGNGSQTSVRVAHAASVSFGVRGVDLFGRVPLPHVLPANRSLEFPLLVGNRIAEAAEVHVHAEVVSEGQLLTWTRSDALVLAAGADGQAWLRLPGLPEGAYEVRLQVVRDGVASPATVVPLGVGLPALQVTSVRGALEGPSDGVLAAAQDASVSVGLKNIGFNPYFGSLIWHVDDVILGSEKVVVSAGDDYVATTRLPTDGVGSFEVRLQSDETLLWQGQYSVQEAGVSVHPLRLSEGTLHTAIHNDAVAVEVCGNIELWTGVGTLVPGQDDASCRTVGPGTPWELALPLPGLPLGPYEARLHLTWPGGEWHDSRGLHRDSVWSDVDQEPLGLDGLEPAGDALLERQERQVPGPATAWLLSGLLLGSILVGARRR